MALTTRNNAPEVAKRLIRQSLVVTRQMDENARKTALLVQRSARENVPKAESGLVNAIVLEQLRPGVYQVRAAKSYGHAVEVGTRGGGYAPLQSILDWMSVRRIRPDDPDMSPEQLAFLIQQKIGSRGTPAQPYMEPARKAHEGTLLTLMIQGLKYVR